jgi:ABC-type Fe3+/spermidine/putrescine transport system ATPase subunit
MVISIRAENITIAERSSDNGHRGFLTDIVYRGAITRYIVKMNVNTFSVDVTGQPAIPVGAEVSLAWDPAHTVLIAENPV